MLRLLSTLESSGLVQKHLNGFGYQIGLRAFEIGSLFLTASPLASLLTGALDELVEKTQWTAYLGVLERDDVVILNYRAGTLPIRFIWQVGDRLPCATTSLGKAILAHMSPQEIDKHLGKGQKLRGLTEKSLQTRKQLERELVDARRRGWGLAREESHAGLTAVGSAILDEAGHPIAAISISFFDYPPQIQRLERFGGIVRKAAEKVSKKAMEYGNYGLAKSREALTLHA